MSGEEIADANVFGKSLKLIDPILTLQGRLMLGQGSKELSVDTSHSALPTMIYNEKA